MAEIPSHFAALGGREVVERIAHRFYDIMERNEPELTALHPTDEAGRVTREARDRFASFLVFWLGGPDDYPRTHGHPRLRMRHAQVPIDTAMRDAWLRCMQAALRAEDPKPEILVVLEPAFAKVADFLRNRPG